MKSLKFYKGSIYIQGVAGNCLFESLENILIKFK